MGSVLFLCDESGIMGEPWAEAGYDVILVDIQHDGDVTHGRVRKIGADINRFCPPLRKYDFVGAFPPCTDLATSGSRWFRRKGLSALVDALETVDSCRRICEASDAPWFLENPVSTISSYWRKPDYTFDPCDFGGWCDRKWEDAYTKKTCLWTGGGFRYPPDRRVPPTEGSKMHMIGNTDERQELRSKTPRGFARAVFHANRPLSGEGF